MIFPKELLIPVRKMGTPVGYVDTISHVYGPDMRPIGEVEPLMFVKEEGGVPIQGAPVSGMSGLVKGHVVTIGIGGYVEARIFAATGDGGLGQRIGDVIAEGIVVRMSQYATTLSIGSLDHKKVEENQIQPIVAARMAGAAFVLFDMGA